MVSNMSARRRMNERVASRGRRKGGRGGGGGGVLSARYKKMFRASGLGWMVESSGLRREEGGCLVDGDVAALEWGWRESGLAASGHDLVQLIRWHLALHTKTIVHLHRIPFIPHSRNPNLCTLHPKGRS